MRKIHRLAVLQLVLCTTLGLFPSSFAAAASAKDMEPKDSFDRLDGTGSTGKKVDVIEWGTNLEIHVYPKGSLRGLGLKIDRTNKKKPVMVIAYRFNSVTYTVTRRAILSIDLTDSFKTYEEPGTDDYDKIIISNNTLTANVKPFPLDATPTQLYPDHHEMLADKEESKGAAGKSPTSTAAAAGEPAKTYSKTRAPSNGIQFQQSQVDTKEQNDDAPSFKKSTIDEEGGIKSFDF